MLYNFLTTYTMRRIGAAIITMMAASVIIFAFALLMVFLILSAQYEQWSLPLAVITAVPFGQAGHFFQQVRVGRCAVQMDDSGKSTHVGAMAISTIRSANARLAGL